MLSCCYFHYSSSSICFSLSFYLSSIVMQCINCALSNEKFCSSAFTHSTAFSGMLLEILLIIVEHQKNWKAWNFHFPKNAPKKFLNNWTFFLWSPQKKSRQWNFLLFIFPSKSAIYVVHSSPWPLVRHFLNIILRWRWW